MALKLGTPRGVVNELVHHTLGSLLLRLQSLLKLLHMAAKVDAGFGILLVNPLLLLLELYFRLS